MPLAAGCQTASALYAGCSPRFASTAIYGLTAPRSPLQFEVPGTTFRDRLGFAWPVGGRSDDCPIFAPFLGKGPTEAKVAATASR